MPIWALSQGAALSWRTYPLGWGPPKLRTHDCARLFPIFQVPSQNSLRPPHASVAGIGNTLTRRAVRPAPTQ